MSGSNPFRRNVGLAEGNARAPLGGDDLIARAEAHFPALDTGICSVYRASRLPMTWLIHK